MIQPQALIEVKDIKKSFLKKGAQELLVLDDVNFALNSGEIVALLGKSGSGKSTLLRIIAGLIKPTAGKVLCRGETVLGPVEGLTMVFQNFALMPWLTVLENVELGLEAQGIPRDQRRVRALEAIDIIGMDGFESAYPKELSGGMRQRVGFARAVVVNPEVILMDEPFSALDVLTAENLRNDLIDLWQNKKTNIKGILLVTHNIEEAVSLANRIILFDTDPGTIRAELKVDLPYPREAQDKRFREIVDEVYTLMTKPEPTTLIGKEAKAIDLGYRLPKTDIAELTGLLDELTSPEYKEKVDLPELADALNLGVDDLFPITEVLEILHFAVVSHGDIELTAEGKTFVAADILDRKKIFAEHLMRYVPLARHIRHILDKSPGNRVDEKHFLEEMEKHLSEEAAEEVLKIIIDWARYAEIFAYDYNTGLLSLENPE